MILTQFIKPRPLGDVNAAMRDLDMSGERVRALVDEGVLVAFNISAKPAGKSNLRVLTRSIERYAATGSREPFVMDFSELFKLVYPHDKLFARGVELQRSLNCDRGHVENLIASGSLKSCNPSSAGREGSPMVTVGSFKRFLWERMEGGEL